MSESTLPVAVIGVGGVGGLIVQGLLDTDCVDVVGISDRDPAALERAQNRFNLPAYTDNRSLLAETRPAAVYLAAPPTVAPEIITACAGRGIHVWKEPPLARNLDEGVSLVRQMEDAGLKFAVGTGRRFAAGYRQAWQWRDRVSEVFLARAHYMFNWGPQLGWRGDKASAGGGALLEVGYHPIDLLVWSLGLPEVAYGLNTCGHRPDQTGPKGQPLPVYDTDDTAVAVLGYSGGPIASVVTTRRAGPISEGLSLHGREGSLTATAESCLLCDPEGNVLDRTDSLTTPEQMYRLQVEAFATSVLNEAASYQCSGRENLLPLAVIEAVYLSARTGQPESPVRLLKARDLTEADCLTWTAEQEDTCR